MPGIFFVCGRNRRGFFRYPDIRLRLMVSFKVLEMLNKIPHWDVSEGAESIFALD